MRIEQKRGGKVYLYSLNKSEKSLEINENAIISSADYHLNRLTHSLHNIGFVSMNHFDSEWYSTFDQTTKKNFYTLLFSCLYLSRQRTFIHNSFINVFNVYYSIEIDFLFYPNIQHLCH